VLELTVELACLAALAAYAMWLGGRRWFLVLVAPLPAFVLLHQEIPVRHCVAYGPAALPLVTGWRADRAWRNGDG